jgi:hypothetical protein
MFKIGKRYRLHGKFNFGDTFSGVLAEMDANFMKFTDCHDLRNVPGNTIIVGIVHTEAIWPIED